MPSREEVLSVLAGINEITTLPTNIQFRKQNIYYECMDAAGVVIPERFRSPVQPPADSVGLLFDTFGEAPKEQVAKRGYSWSSDGSAEDASQDPFTKWLNAQSQSFRDAFDRADNGDGSTQIVVELNGVSVGASASGCNYESLKAAFGDVKKYLTLISKRNSALMEMRGAVRATLDQGPEVGTWRQCLADGGITAKSPSERPVDSKESKSRQLAVAVADWECRQSSGYPKAVERAVVQAAGARWNDLVALKGEVDALLARAATGSGVSTSVP